MIDKTHAIRQSRLPLFITRLLTQSMIARDNATNKYPLVVLKDVFPCLFARHLRNARIACHILARPRARHNTGHVQARKKRRTDIRSLACTVPLALFTERVFSLAVFSLTFAPTAPFFLRLSPPLPPTPTYTAQRMQSIGTDRPIGLSDSLQRCPLSSGNGRGRSRKVARSL